MTSTPTQQRQTFSPPWHSAYVYYHAPDRSGLILDAVAPVLERLRPDLDRAFLFPHWRQGPHLRINIGADPQVWSARIRPMLDDVIGSYLREHPSTARLSEESTRAQHRYLAERERETGPLSPWYPDNSIQYPPFEPRLHALNDEPAVLDMLLEHQVESNAFFLAALRHLRDGEESAELLGLTLLFTTGQALGGLRRNVGSFRAHASGFLSRCADPVATEEALDAKYDATRPVILERLQAVVDTLDGTATTPLPLVREWAALMARGYERAAPIVASGALAMTEAVRAQSLSDPQTSDYDRVGLMNDAYFRRALLNPEFQRYRIPLNYTYLQLTRFGLPPRARPVLCHLAANAIEETYSINAFETVREFVQAHPGAPDAS